MSARGRPAPVLWCASALIAIVIALMLPAAGQADCGGVSIAQPPSHPRGQLPPLAIGDSTMLLSLPGLAAEGYDANAHGCRAFYEAVALLGQLKAANALPHMVVIALGANGTITTDDIRQALGVLCCNRLLVLVTPRELGGGSGPDAAAERQAAKQDPRRILLLDWVDGSQSHGNWFQPDGLHLTGPGVYAFTALLARALPYAYAPCPRTNRRYQARATVAPGVAERRSSQPTAPTAQGLSLSTTIARTGYLGATITGPAGAAVQLSQRINGQTTPIQRIQIPASGTVSIPRAATWLCSPRLRSLLVTTLPPAPPATATSTAETPSCSRRLLTTIKPRARVGQSITLQLRDRWGLGGLPFSICLAPPGARAGCTVWHLRPSQPQRMVRLVVPRPGGWEVTVTTPYGQRAARTVWAAHPGGRIQFLAAGDSEMQILDSFLGQDLGSHGVNVTSDARISTGLTNSFFFNWQTEASRQDSALHPDVSLVFLGANDGFSVSGAGGRPVSCCSPGWSSGYANLAAEMMTTLLRGNAGRVYWVLLPTPRPGNFQSLFDGVNRGIREAANRFPGRVALIDANAFFTPNNRYRDYMVYHGHGLVVHEADGIHLSTASDAVTAALVAQRLLADRVIH